ncbi:hypothetical protein OG203_04245 [Nocardia sp. NBC_01499]|uniref:hypothetical protein n=1 Tax=Nocardia sp. NBC_01499 TaxID=2903597 RepID=UPI00386F2054
MIETDGMQQLVPGYLGSIVAIHGAIVGVEFDERAVIPPAEADDAAAHRFVTDVDRAVTRPWFQHQVETRCRIKVLDGILDIGIIDLIVVMNDRSAVGVITLNLRSEAETRGLGHRGG